MSRVLQALGLSSQPAVVPEPVAEPLRPSSDRCEALLIALAQYGRPWCFMTSQLLWTAHVDLAGFSVGVSGQVKSDNGHRSPVEALECCLQRCVEALGPRAGGSA